MRKSDTYPPVMAETIAENHGTTLYTQLCVWKQIRDKKKNLFENGIGTMCLNSGHRNKNLQFRTEATITWGGGHGQGV